MTATAPDDMLKLAELLPCPFCGSKAQLKHGYWIECDNCGVGVSAPATDITVRGVTARWNARVAPTHVEVLTTRLRPMSSAPMDGREILGYWSGGKTWSIIYCSDLNEKWCDEGGELMSPPTHWHPLPDDTEPVDVAEGSREAREKEITRLATIAECAELARKVALQLIEGMKLPADVRAPNDKLSFGHKIADRIEADIKALAVPSAEGKSHE